MWPHPPPPHHPIGPVSFLHELATETHGQPLNVNELRAVLRVVDLAAADHHAREPHQPIQPIQPIQSVQSVQALAARAGRGSGLVSKSSL